MKVYITLVALFLSYIAHGQTYSKIDKSIFTIKDSIFVQLFDRPTNIQGQIVTGAVNVTKKETNLIVIKNFDNNGFTSQSITFTIDQNLEIKSYTYDQSTDVIDGSSTEYYIEDLMLTLNFNPFLNGTKDLQGRYSFNLKRVWKPDEILEARGIKAETTYRKFNGKFKN